jgi:hypothetical protein
VSSTAGPAVVADPVRHTARVPTLRLAEDPAADERLSRDPLALVLGMMLDQHTSRRGS